MDAFGLEGYSGIAGSAENLLHPRGTREGIHDGMLTSASSDDEDLGPARDCCRAHLISVFEMSLTGEEHGDAFLVGEFDGILVTDAAARLDNGLDAVLCSEGNHVVEREESV